MALLTTPSETSQALLTTPFGLERRDEVAAGRDGHRRGDGEPAKQCRTAVPSSMTLEGV